MQSPDALGLRRPERRCLSTPSTWTAMEAFQCGNLKLRVIHACKSPGSSGEGLRQGNEASPQGFKPHNQAFQNKIWKPRGQVPHRWFGDLGLWTNDRLPSPSYLTTFQNKMEAQRGRPLCRWPGSLDGGLQRVPLGSRATDPQSCKKRPSEKRKSLASYTSAECARGRRRVTCHGYRSGSP